MISRKLYFGLEAATAAACRLFPDRFVLGVRSRLETTVPMDYRLPIRIVADSPMEYGTRRLSCAKEPEMVTWIESFEGGDVFYDVGANIGAYSLVAARAHEAHPLKVYAFEPSFLNYHQLCRNVALNKVHSISPLPLALSDTTGIGTFNYHSLEIGGSLHTFGEAIDYRGERFDPVFTQPLIAFRIDDLPKLGIAAPQHIKIDVDGIEFKVLQGADQTLRGVKSLMLEIDEGDAEGRAMVAYLKDRGLELAAKHKFVFGSSDHFPNMFNYEFRRSS